jgi:peptidyl-prolyl cis-trans isomerase C
MNCSVHTQIPTAAAKPITVNGVTIARGAIQREMQYHPAQKPIAAWQQAATALVVRELLLQRARHLGLAPEPQIDAEGRRETDEEATIRALIAHEVTVPEPDDETCWRYYQRNQARFRSPDIYEASHILFAAAAHDDAGYAQACADAVAVLKALQNNPGRFSALASAHSRCPSAAQGGNLGQITQGQTTPEFEQALMALAPGELSAEPVASRYGFHIIRLDRKHEGRTLPYDAVAQRIADYLRESVQRRAQAQYVARLVSAGQIDGLELAGVEAHQVN